MSDALFSPEEMDALRDDMKRPADPVQPIDLVAGDHALRKNTPVVSRRLQVLGESVHDLLTRHIRQGFPFTLGAADTVGPVEAREALSSNLKIDELRNQKDELLGYIGLDPWICCLVVERAFGAPAELDDDATLPARDRLTDIERETLSPLAAELAYEIAQKLLQADDGETLRTVTPEGVSPELPSDVESALRWTAELDLGAERTGRVTLVLLPSAIETAVSHDDGEDDVIPVDWMSDHLARTQVQISTHLGQVHVSVSELLSLRPGDLLRLDNGQDEDVPVLIEGATKLSGKPVQRNGAYGVEITGRVEKN